MLLVIAVSRLLLLFLSQHFLLSDEAVTGVMAIDILKGRPIPLFHYGNNYAGGHTIEALLMVPWFKLWGARDWIVAGVPALMACLFLTVVYETLYRFFSKRLALAALAIFSFCCAFVSYNFEVNGSMTTMFFAWSGLYFFFCHHYGERPRPYYLILSGACLGFAVYCFDYALFYIIAIGGLLAYRHRLGLWRQWKALGALMAGGMIGMMPLLIYNFTHQFSNFKHLIAPGQAPREPLLPDFCKRAYYLATYYMPAFLTTEINKFKVNVPWYCHVAWITFCLALGYLAFQLRGPLRDWMRGLWRRRPPKMEREARILFFLYLFALYAVIYCLSPYGGSEARYCILFHPALPILFAGAMLRLGRSRPRWAALGTVLFMAPQLWQLVLLAGDKTTSEWYVTTHGEDIPKLARYLEENHYTNIVTPYEIKWKLLFASEERILSASDLFGYDRETVYNQIVTDRINRRQAPLVMVFDKELKIPGIVRFFNPKGAFDVDGFFNFLKQYGITYQTTAIGDYVVYHHFSRFFPLVENRGNLNP